MNTQALAERYNSRMTGSVKAILESNRSWSTRHRDLMVHLEGADERKKMIAMKTLIAMDNQQRFLEQIRRDPRLEATFSQALGPLVPRVIDVVRIFYPNLIAQDLVDIQPMDRQNGEIFTVQPVFSNTGGGVNAGDQIFKNPTDGTYASESISQVLGTGNGTTTAFNGTLAPQPIRPGTVTVTAGNVKATDNGAGVLSGTGVSGTINYATGAVSVTYTTAPANGASVAAQFKYDSEQNPSSIREVEIKLGNMPVTADEHPLKLKYSTTAELAASSHLDINIGDILTNLTASLIKNERDILLANMINTVATADANLNFDATPPSNYSKLARYSEFETKLDYAESQIQINNGRGGVSWVMCGSNVANILRQCSSFESSDIQAPIGPYRCGTLRDGTVPVIKVPTMNPNTYVTGFKGYVVGDAATILAEWIPLYASPLFRSYDLNNYQGLMSMYALVNNNPGYYLKGTVSGYAA